jgi:hypothetical protein
MFAQQGVAMRNFETEQEFLDAVAQALPHDARAVGPLSGALIAGVREANVAVREGTLADAGGLNLRIKGWVLRNDDLPVVEAIGIVGAAATAALGPGGIAAAAVITAVTSFAAMCWKAWRKGAPLSRREIAVLGFLEINGPMDEEELARKASAQLKDFSADEVRKALRGLTDVELRNGEIVSLVRKDSSGQWRARPV